MRKPLQISPAWIAAFLCTAVWYSLFAFCFKPETTDQPGENNPPAFVRLTGENGTTYHLLDPSRFALPGQKGFSGTFPAENVEIPFKFNSPETPSTSTPRKNQPLPDIGKILLPEKTETAPPPLPIPGRKYTTAAIPSIKRTTLLFSPELKTRAADTQLDINRPAGLPDSTRVHLQINPDGIVQHALFETAVTNTDLINAVRRLSFKPTVENTEGTLEIRFPQKGAR